MQRLNINLEAEGDDEPAARPAKEKVRRETAVNHVYAADMNNTLRHLNLGESLLMKVKELTVHARSGRGVLAFILLIAVIRVDLLCPSGIRGGITGGHHWWDAKKADKDRECQRERLPMVATGGSAGGSEPG